ncbi:outer membrane autotransporter protein [Cupriavidus plantarum]|nr:autotransporter outer membrane beta-barrel domain-containing protein [Cupriavidus plantarum]NYI02121.1 outer membrane autotransporter protein [Cupriavidus plantarum]CAG2139034.1 hypothetical protein LMG26296_02812 [Cupriavidus plantarum]SMR85781.1 outer membrane autotransporter barrel domain-containing protein [Cupriavidus plantarum]
MMARDKKFVCNSALVGYSRAFSAAFFRRSVLSAAAMTLVWTIVCSRPASAQLVTGTGELIPAPVQTPNWNVGSELIVGDSASGALSITGGATVGNTDSYVGVASTGQGSITVSGRDSGGQASTWTSSGQVNIGYDGLGTVLVDGGGVVNSGITVIGLNSGAIGAVATGAVTITGHDGNGHASTWNSAAQIYVGFGGTGSLQIRDGGVMHSGQGIIASESGSVGHVTVSDPNSLWDPVGNIYVGFAGTGELNVQNGATVSTAGPAGPTSAASIYIGYGAGSDGTVTISGTGAAASRLSATDRISVGVDGAGTLNVAKGGVVSAGSDVHIAGSSTSSGTLNLTGDASGRGIVETGSVIRDAGLATLNLDGGILRANRNEPNFLNGFTTLTVGGEGAWFDTNAHDVGVSTAFSGTSTLNKLGLGTLSLTGNSAGFTGNTEVLAGTLRVDGVLGGPTNVSLSGRLTGTGVVGTTTNRGVIAPGGAAPFGTLTVAGNYASSGGSLEVRTQLGDDSSPTDRLVIKGDTSGQTPIKIINVGGVGAQTQKGIQVVQVNGASAGAFTLANGDYVIAGQPAIVAGAYGYVLRKGQTDGNWYLSSSLRDAVAAPPAEPPGDSPPVAGDDGGRLYQPGAPVYEAYANTLQSLSQVPTLRQRVGNRQYDTADVRADGIWARVEGARRRLEPSTSTTGVQQSINSWKAQFGVDRILSGDERASRLVGGLTAQYGTANTHLQSVFGGGNIDTTALGLGPTLTWYSADGAYLDVQGYATWFDSDLNSSLAGRLAKGQNAHSYSVSVEAGKSVPVSAGLAVVPQVQFSYVAASFNAIHDRFGAEIDSDRDKSILGRIGVALDYKQKWTSAAGKTQQASFYGVLNVKHEFLDGTQVRISGVPVGSRLGSTWGGAGIGWNYAWSERYAVYGEVGADTDFSGSYAASGTAGFRMVF